VPKSKSRAKSRPATTRPANKNTPRKSAITGTRRLVAQAVVLLLVLLMVLSIFVRVF
jgi:hypothetical protein